MYVHSMSARVFKRLYHPNTLEHALPKVLKPLSYDAESDQFRVLKNALEKHVPEHGFNERAIVSSLNELGFSSSFLSSLGSSNSPSFFNASPSVLELVKFHLVTKRNELVQN